ncbi:hypothetical protein AUP68_00832 [Ilyonectria robusta]
MNMEKKWAAIPGDGSANATFITTQDMSKFVAHLMDVGEWPAVSFIASETLSFNQLVAMPEKARGECHVPCQLHRGFSAQVCARSLPNPESMFRHDVFLSFSTWRCVCSGSRHQRIIAYKDFTDVLICLFWVLQSKDLTQTSSPFRLLVNVSALYVRMNVMILGPLALQIWISELACSLALKRNVPLSDSARGSTKLINPSLIDLLLDCRDESRMGKAHLVWPWQTSLGLTAREARTLICSR